MIERKNFLLVDEYLEHLRNKKRSEETVGRYYFWLRHLLLWADKEAFGKIYLKSPSFGTYLEELQPALHPEGQRKIIETSKAFLKWGKLHYPKAFKELQDYWIEDLTPPRNVTISASASFVTVEEAIQLVHVKIDPTNLALIRDRAISALLFCSGARAGAATTLPITAVHLDSEFPYLSQLPELGVKTKNRKAANTFLLPIEELMAPIREWDGIVRSRCEPTYPWYAPVDQKWGEQSLTARLPGENRSHALNRRLRILFNLAGLPPKSPHKFRHGNATYGLQHCKTMEEFKAVSVNLIHSTMTITDQIYAHQNESERAKLLSGLVHNSPHNPGDELRIYLEGLSQKDVHRGLQILASRLSE